MSPPDFSKHKYQGKAVAPWLQNVRALLMAEGLAWALQGEAARKKDYPHPEKPWSALQEERAKGLVLQLLDDATKATITDDEVADPTFWAFHLIERLRTTHSARLPGMKRLVRARLTKIKMPAGHGMLEHLTNFRQVLQEYKDLGGEAEDDELIDILATSLPADRQADKDFLDILSSTMGEDELTLEDAMQHLLRRDLKRQTEEAEKPAAAFLAQGPPLAAQGPTRGRSQATCFRCGEQGHRYYKCKAQKPQASWASHWANPDSETYSPSGVEAMRNGSRWVRAGSAPAPTGGCGALDSGATTSLVASRGKLTNYAPLPRPRPIQCANDGVVWAQGRGEIRVQTSPSTPPAILPALHVPGVAKDLVAVKDLAKNGIGIFFGENGCKLLPGVKDVDALGAVQVKELDGLFQVPLVDGDADTALLAHALPESAEGQRWHARLGHAPPRVMEGMARSKKYAGLASASALRAGESVCDVCATTKAVMRPHPARNAGRSTVPGQLVHSDVMGPLREHGPAEERYIVCFIDDATHYLAAYTMAHKSEVLQHLRTFHAMLHALTGQQIKSLQSDNGGEYTSKAMQDYCKDKLIHQRFTTPDSPESNGVVERMNRTLVLRMRALIHHANIPPQMWPHALATATYLINRSPTSTLPAGESPYQRLTGKAPDLSNLRVFGCQAYYTIPTAQRDDPKLGASGRAGVFLGYEEGGATRLWDLEEAILVRTRDVIFDESKLPFRDDQEQAGPDGDLFNELLATRTDAHLPPHDEELLRATDTATGNDTTFSNDDELPELASEENVAGSDASDALDASDNARPSQSPPRPHPPPTADVDSIVNDVDQRRAQYARDPIALLRDLSRQTEPRADLPLAPVEEPLITQSEPQHAHAQQMNLPRSADAVEGDPLATYGGQAHVPLLPGAWPAPEEDDDPLTAAFLASAESGGDGDPASFAEAQASPEAAAWDAAMREELDSFKAHDVWTLCELPPKRKAIGVRWVFKTKRDEHGEIERHKARLVAKGYTQRAGVDYDETFAPVVRYETLRLLLAVSCQQALDLSQMDVKTAFLNGKLDEEIYVRQPQGFEVPGQEGKVYRLHRAVYGLKQASRAWHKDLDATLTSFGLKASKHDPCLYWMRQGGKVLYVLIYVDDLILASNDPVLTAKLKDLLKSKYEIKDLGRLRYCLGMLVEHDKDAGTLRISQQAHIEEMLKRYGMHECRPAATPEVEGSGRPQAQAPIASTVTSSSSSASTASSSTTAVSCAAEHVVPTTTPGPAPQCVHTRIYAGASGKSYCPPPGVDYRGIVGSLGYLAMTTRPDIAHAVRSLSVCQSKAGPACWLAAMRVLRYLAGTASLGLNFSACAASSDFRLEGFCDASWGSCVEDRRSVTGYLFALGGCTVSWRSIKQRSCALSTAEAEYYALSDACKEAVWLRGMLSEIGVPLGGATILHEDNQAVLAMVKRPVCHSTTKHIDIRHHHVRQRVSDGEVALRYVGTGEQAADILTKPLGRVAFGRMLPLLRMCSPSQPVLAQGEC